MSNFNITNIKDLPQLEQILSGNFLVVENNVGTNKLDFSDFVIGPSNTSFANKVFNDILSLSSYSISLSSTANNNLTALSASIGGILSSFSTGLSSLCATIFDGNNIGASEAKQGLVKMYKTSLFIPGNTNKSTLTFSFPTNTILSLTKPDIKITADYISSTFYFDYSIISQVVNQDNTTTYSVEISTFNANSNNINFFVSVLTI